jgi:hypothetical protein
MLSIPPGLPFDDGSAARAAKKASSLAFVIGKCNIDWEVQHTLLGTKQHPVAVIEFAVALKRRCLVLAGDSGGGFGGLRSGRKRNERSDSSELRAS